MAGKGRPGPECGIKRALGQLDSSSGEIADMILTDPDERSWTDARMASALTELVRAAAGDDWPAISKAVVTHHRRRDCRCFQAAA